MNKLSWLLYLADVSAELDLMFTILSVVFAVVSIIMVLVAFAMVEEAASAKSFKNLAKAFAFAICAFIFTFTLSALVPSKNTIYAIAASEMGQQLGVDKTVSKALQGLDHWLDKQIADK